MNAQLRAALTAHDADDLKTRFDEPMANHTTYKIGGPAAAYIEVASEEALTTIVAQLAAFDAPYLVLGNGSNVLFADAGFTGAVIRLVKGLDEVTLHPDIGGGYYLEAGAGLSVTRLLRFVKSKSLAGLECLAGVPGTIGGALRMNAGTKLGELSESLVAARLVTPDGKVAWYNAVELGLAYRYSELPVGAIVVGARFKVTSATPEMWDRMAQILAYRKSTQPLTIPSCGSVFSNPHGDSAGRLIEAAGLKGFRHGGAQVSEVHANWIVNMGGATAADVVFVLEHCIAEVARQFDIVLSPEVHRLGDWTRADRAPSDVVTP